jgi:DNA-binding TFAR19-related protein (PDSD5 family)
MKSSELLRRVALVRTDVSEEVSASFIRVSRIGELEPSSPILDTLMKEALISSETSVLTSAIQRTIPEGAILHSHRPENLKSYTN